MTAIYRALLAIFGNRLRLLEASGRDIQTIGRIRFGPRTLVFVNSPDLVQQVLVEKLSLIHI